MKYLSVLLLLLFFIPVYSFAEGLVNECFATDDAYYRLIYAKKIKYKKAISYKLFVSYKTNNDKYRISGDNLELNDDNSIKELIFKNYGSINDIIVMKSLKPKTITVNGEIKSVKKMDCYAFISTFDRYIDENGKSVSIYTKGKSFMEEKFKSSSYKPSFNCKKATSSIEKAICSNSEVSYLDNLFHSSTKCYKEILLSHVKNQEYFENQMDILINDFMSYRDLSYKSDNGTFTNKELEQVKKSYMLGLMFIPMVVGANDGDLFILGKKLFMSYYMLSMQGVKFTEKHAQKGFGISSYGLYPNEYNDEIMYYYAGVYDNFNSKLPHLFYYTVYLLEKYGIVDSEGNYKCKH